MLVVRGNTNNIKLQEVKRKSAPLSFPSPAPKPVPHPEIALHRVAQS